jgi:hypothetical protein
MIRITILGLIAGALYLALMGEVQRRDEITLQQRADLREHRATQ